MARLAGVDLPRDKRVEVALTYIFGMGRSRSQQTLVATGVNPDTRVRDLDDAELVRIHDWIDGNYRIEGDLRREVASDIRHRSRDRLLPGPAAPPRPAGARSADPHQCAHP